MDENCPSEQLEEGEIVDDDDFEDISDNSIIESSFGKFVSSNENLRALSLSSDSESETLRIVRHKRKLLRHKNGIRHQRKRKRRRIVSESSGSDASPCEDLKGKLKEAIHISGSEGTHKNTLEKRLKAMEKLGNNPESVTIIPEPSSPKPSPLLSTPIPTTPPLPPPPSPKLDDSDKIDDAELETLRLEALKTAILNKYQRRKKKKTSMQEQTEETKPLETLENKENDTPKEAPSLNNNHEKVEVETAEMDLDEDEDVLRAALLAGLAKKITKAQPTNVKAVKIKTNAMKLPIKVAPVLPKRPISNFSNSNNIIQNKIIQSRPKPQVKPLIINVNDDSDSDEEIKQMPPPSKPQGTDLKVITNNVEKFLKEQRAKFETETTKRVQINKNKTILEKSAVKLLPKSQQIEYQQLLKRLKIAERKKRAKKIALQRLKVGKTQELPKPVEPINITDLVTVDAGAKPTTVEIVSSTDTISTVEVVIQPVSDVISAVESTPKSDSSSASKEQMLKDSDSEGRKSRITNELTTLQKTLKEMKMQRNGSLQIKSKYQVLKPIIRKITTTSNERKKQEQRIKKLLQELNDARSSLARSHETFSALVKELVSKKERIDKSCEDTKTYKKTRNGNIVLRHAVNVSKEQEISNQRHNKDTKAVPVTSTPIKTQSNGSLVEEPTISTIITTSTNNDYEDMDVCNSDEPDMCQIDIVDPNDIDQIFKRKSTVTSAIPEYVSPLNFNTYERYKNVDPLGIMCPYEVNGSCRDIDCTFKHYLKNHERM